MEDICRQDVLKTSWAAYGYISYARFVANPMSPKTWAGGGASGKTLIRELARLTSEAIRRDLWPCVFVPVLILGRPHVQAIPALPAYRGEEVQ